MKIPGGPWESVLETEQTDYAVRLQANSESELLVVLTEKHGGKQTGVVLELFKVLVFEQNPSSLLEKLDFAAMEIGMHTDARTTQWFVLLDSNSTYVRADDTQVASEYSALKQKIKGFQKNIETAGKALHLSFVPLAESSDAAKQAFFASPLVESFLLEKTKAAERPKKSETEKGFEQFGEIKLGQTRDGTLVHEPLVLFKKTLVLGGNAFERSQAMRILIESALLSGFASVVFDAQNQFQGLKEQNPNEKAVTQSGFGLTPLGFPMEEFDPPDKVRVNFSAIDMDAVLELFRVGDTPAYKVIKLVFELGVAGDLSQLVDAIKIQKPGGEVTRFYIYKAMRIAALINQMYPAFFNGPNDIDTISRRWERGIGKAGIVRLNRLDNRLRLILVHSLVQEILHHYKNTKKHKAVSTLLFFPQAKDLFPYKRYWKIQKLIEEDILEATQYGVGVVLGCEKAMEIHENIMRPMTSEIGIVNQNDVGVRIEKRKPYRAKLRVPLSRP